MSKIKVFIIDDSVMVRQLFSQVINASNDMEVVGVAADPIMAEKKMSRVEVDVILLDVEMPKMNGLEYLAKIMEENPKPVIICSAQVEDKHSSTAQRALSLGAAGLISKNDTNVREFVNNSSNKVIETIKVAANKKIIAKKDKRKIDRDPVKTQQLASNKRPFSKNISSKYIAIGSSTGGVQIIEKILVSLPEQTPPILIVQHMPAGFIASMANRISKISNIMVKEAVDGEEVLPNTAYISPGDIHMKIEKNGAGFKIALQNSDKVSHHKPSVDVLFKSFAANVSGSHIKAFILTGMGFDGAAGIKEIKNVGGETYAQSESTCTVYGMPKEAVNLGAIDQSLDPEDMAKVLLR